MCNFNSRLYNIKMTMTTRVKVLDARVARLKLDINNCNNCSINVLAVLY